MKICVIGTSHLAALKLGWEMVRDQFPDLELVFFGSPGVTLRQLQVKGKRLVAGTEALAKSLAFTSGGLTEIVVSDYDACLLYGIAFPVPRLRRGISLAVMHEVVTAQASAGLLVKTARRVRRLTDKRLWLAANPLEMAPGDRHEAATFHPHDVLLEVAQRAFAVPDAVFLPQPADTIGPDLRAPARFGEGSVRLLPKDEAAEPALHAKGDVSHMNGEYGKRWLEANLPVIRAGA